jgi:NAD(P)-dependent dehydrogenase (short-subunit alcohol dehydrogenase family)
MPLAKIHVLEGQYDEARLARVSSAVQDGLVSTLGIPPDGFFQIIHPLPRSQFRATKAAVRSFARTWTTDLKDRRIRVNAESPGFADTPAWHATEAGEQHLKRMSGVIPLGRPGTIDEIAKAVVFLASDDSSYVTGAELFVDGGFVQV